MHGPMAVLPVVSPCARLGTYLIQRSVLNPQDATVLEAAERLAQACDEQLRVDCPIKGLEFFKCNASRVDAVRALCTTAVGSPGFGYVDIDTEICMLREGLAAIRPQFALALLDGVFSTSLFPYFRFLFAFSRLSTFHSRPEISVAALEEIARWDPNDQFGSRAWLLSGYLKLLARADRALAEGVPPGWFREEKTIRAACGGLRAPVAVWKDIVELFLVHRAGGEWRPLLDALTKQEPELWAGIAGVPQHRTAPRVVLLEPLMLAILDWPALAEAVVERVPGARRDLMIACNRDRHVGSWGPLTRDAHVHFGVVAESFLEQARPLLAAGRYVQAFAALSQARQYQAEGSRPGVRWYVNAPWAIASNRATAAEQLGLAHLARLDARFTLSLNPEHLRSYELLARVVANYGAEQPASELAKLAVNARAGGWSGTKWRALADDAIAWSSVAAIVAGSTGGITDELFAHLRAVGVDDAYTPLNIDPQFAPLAPGVGYSFSLSG